MKNKPVKDRPGYAVTSVDHALQLATILQVEGPLTVSGAAERLGVARSTAHRLLSTLVYRDFAAQTPDRRYVAGPVLALGARSPSRAALLRAAAMPHLARLTERTGESSNLTVLLDDHVRFIGSVESPRALRVGNREGMVFPAHLASGGIVLLADLDQVRLAELYAPSRWQGRDEPRPDLVALDRDLTAARRTGMAINSGRTEDGVTALGVPVRGPDGRAVAAVSVSMPSLRFDQEAVAHVGGALRAAARDLGDDLSLADPV